MRSLVLVPEAVLAVGAGALLVGSRLGLWSGRARRRLPVIAAALVLIALAFEATAGAILGSYFDGTLIQDRFALFAKLAVLLATLIAILASDWGGEDLTAAPLALALLGAIGVMVAASASDLIGLWAGVELTAGAAVAVVAIRHGDLGLRLLLSGAAASAMVLLGFAYLYGITGSADLAQMRAALDVTQPTIVVAVPVLLLLAGLVLRAVVGPVQATSAPASQATSPFGAGLSLGLVAAACTVAAVKVVASMTPLSAAVGPFLQWLAAISAIGGGAGALAARTVRARLGLLAAGQLGWLLAGLSTHYELGLGSSLFLLGAFVVAATCGPIIAGRADAADEGLTGLGTLRPARAAGLSLAMLSLAGAPPLAGFFGEMTVAAALAQSGAFVLLALVMTGGVMSVAATLGTLRLMYLTLPLEETRRAGAPVVPATTALASSGAVALCCAIAAYGIFASPISSLADQGARALGLR